MSQISKDTTETISESLYLYYKAIESGDLKLLSSIMREASYFIALESFGFKHSLKDEKFRETLKNIDRDDKALDRVEKVISADLRESPREHKLDINEIESNGPERIILHYREDGHPKKLYYSYSDGMWKIDYMAGRRK